MTPRHRQGCLGGVRGGGRNGIAQVASGGDAGWAPGLVRSALRSAPNLVLAQCVPLRPGHRRLLPGYYRAQIRRGGTTPRRGATPPAPDDGGGLTDLFVVAEPLHTN